MTPLYGIGMLKLNVCVIYAVEYLNKGGRFQIAILQIHYKYTVIFLLKKKNVKILCCKGFSHFSYKNNSVFAFEVDI